MYCTQDGYHQDEPLEMICLKQECISNNKVLSCIVCVEEHHKGHPMIHYSKFSTLLQKQAPALLSEIELKYGDTKSLNFEAKYKDIIGQLTDIQEQLNITINKSKDILQRKMEYISQYSTPLPQYETFNKAIKSNDLPILSKLISQFLLKVDYNPKRQDLSLRSEFIADQSEELKGENELFHKITEAIQLLQIGLPKHRSRINTNNSFKSNNSPGIMKKSMTLIQDEFIRVDDRKNSNAFVNRGYNSVDKSALSPGFVDDRISMSQSLSQYYYKPKGSNKILGEAKTNTHNETIPNSLSMNSTFGFSFHNEFFAEGLQVIPKQVKLTVDGDRKMALLKPAILGSGMTREVKVKLLIKVCRNTNQRYPMAVGICDLSNMRGNNFIFSGLSEHIPAPLDKSQSHGCNILNSNGQIRSQLNDMAKSSPNVRFYSNSTLELTFKPFHKQLVINRDQQVQTTINLSMNDNAKLHFCVRMADLHDCIEIV